MLNPDGVIVGNYRCSLAGQDLNRQWANPKRKLFPEIQATKDAIKKTLENRKIELFCDFHGHSRKMNIFLYGCEPNENKNTVRVFPYMLSKLLNGCSFEECSFAIQKPRESTARVTVWRDYNVMQSFTCETSFCGYKDAKGGYHFNQSDLRKIGYKFCEAVLNLTSSHSEILLSAYKELHNYDNSKIQVATEKDDDSDTADEIDLINNNSIKAKKNYTKQKLKDKISQKSEVNDEIKRVGTDKFRKGRTIVPTLVSINRKGK